MKHTSLKALFLILSLLLFTRLYAQTNLNGYKYVYVPSLQYQNGGIDIWSISSKLRSYFSEKGFIIVSETNIPLELKTNPCLLLEAAIDHTNVEIGTNEVTLYLKNCKGEIVYQSTGKAMGMSVQDDFNKATKRAFEGIQKAPYRFDPTQTPSLAVGTAETTKENEATLKEYYKSGPIEAVEGIYKSYQDESIGYYKFGIKKDKDRYIAIILESDNPLWKPGEIKAYLEPTSVKGVFSIRWLMGNKSAVESFATMETDAVLEVELKDQKGQKSMSKFIKTYPVNIAGATKPSQGGKSSGSGFFVSADGLIATNAHVIENGKKIRVRLNNETGSKTYTAKVELKDARNDVAVIKIDDPAFKELSPLPYTLIEKAEIGEKSFTIGYPLNDVMGTNYKVTDGLISSNTGIEDDVRYYQISVPIQPGNSGGPLFNKDGNIVGLTSARLNPKAVGTSVENVNYAIKIQYLNNILNMLPTYTAPKTQSQVKGKDLQEQVKILKNYVCLIEVEE